MADMAYTEKGTIFIPEVQIMKLEKDWKRTAIRGYGYIDAVIDHKGHCVGWAVKANPII